jgi:hypothetical protein
MVHGSLLRGPDPPTHVAFGAKNCMYMGTGNRPPMVVNKNGSYGLQLLLSAVAFIRAHCSRSEGTCERSAAYYKTNSENHGASCIYSVNLA